jgi:hypothetical protein
MNTEKIEGMKDWNIISRDNTTATGSRLHWAALH